MTKRILNLTLGLLTLSSPLLYAQENPDNNKSKKLELTDFSIFRYTNYFDFYHKRIDLEDFQKFSPNSVNMPNELPVFFPSRVTGIQEHNSIVIASNFDFIRKGKSKLFANRSLRAGLFYNNQSFLGSGYGVQVRSPYGAAILNSTGVLIPIELVEEYRYIFRYLSRQLGLDASLIFKSRPEKRFVFYSGIGLTAAKSISATTSVYYSYYSRLDYKSEDDLFKNYRPEVDRYSETEESKANGNASFAAYIPLGLDFTIGKRNKWLRRAHLFYEIRGSYYTVIVGNYGAENSTLLSTGLGFRYSLN